MKEGYLELKGDAPRRSPILHGEPQASGARTLSLRPSGRDQIPFRGRNKLAGTSRAAHTGCWSAVTKKKVARYLGIGSTVFQAFSPLSVQTINSK